MGMRALPGGVPGREMGRGPTVIILHPGLDDGRGWDKVARLLAAHNHVIIPVRRWYRERVDDGVTIADDVRDACTVAAATAAPAVLVGHSSGGIVALEALVARPDLFVGAVLYEPPVLVDEPLGGRQDNALVAAASLHARGHDGAALARFLYGVVELSRLTAAIAGRVAATIPRYRRLIGPQLKEAGAINDLGVRLGAYSTITARVLLVGGASSPEHLGRRLSALENLWPHVQRTTLPGCGHDANLKAPELLADLIGKFVAEVNSSP